MKQYIISEEELLLLAQNQDDLHRIVKLIRSKQKIEDNINYLVSKEELIKLIKSIDPDINPIPNFLKSKQPMELIRNYLILTDTSSIEFCISNNKVYTVGEYPNQNYKIYIQKVINK